VSLPFDMNVGHSLHAAWQHRAPQWQLRTRALTFGTRPLLMGILNVTPDSFSDGGQFSSTAAAIAHGERLLAAGADILDIGGESTRPQAAPVAANEELRRILPVIEALAKTTTAPLSIDTSKAVVAEAALAAGAEIINDVTGLTGDPAMLQVALQSQAGVCVMHMQGTPQTMQDNPTYTDVVREVAEYLQARQDQLVAAGLDVRRICLDPGIGFGKTNEHNRLLMANSYRFHALGCPILIGHSRKYFLGKLIGDTTADRTFATAGAACALAAQGVQVIRVHDVAAVRQALLTFDACGPVAVEN